MREETQAHVTSVSVVEAAPLELVGGSDMALRVRVSCPSSCNLQGGLIAIVAQDEVVGEAELVSFDGTANETDAIVVKAPTHPGEYTWTAVYTGQEQADASHAESSAPFSFVVKPHPTSMAVWDIPSPVVMGARFKIKIGVRCAAGCKLTGGKVEVHDHQGAKMATVTLGDDPWSVPGALYWSEVELEAPGVEGQHKWAAMFLKADSEPTHEGSSFTFSFRTAKQPEHVVTVEVVDKESHEPLEKADVVLHPYRSRTDEHGVAKLMVPKGEYGLYVARNGNVTLRTTVTVTDDVTVKAELIPAPPVDDNW